MLYVAKKNLYLLTQTSERFEGLCLVSDANVLIHQALETLSSKGMSVIERHVQLAFSENESETEAFKSKYGNIVDWDTACLESLKNYP